MDFGAILDKWEKQTPGKKIIDKDASALNDSGRAYGERRISGERRSRLLRKKPDAYIDLHGLSRDEAWNSLEKFFEDSLGRGFEKIQIIHGKGGHSLRSDSDTLHSGEAALRDLSRRFIEICSFAGESGYCSASEGGTGATWVILKKKD